MRRTSPVTRISIGLVVVTAGLILVGDLLGVTPSLDEAALAGRKKFCEILAVQFSLQAQKNDMAGIRRAMELAAERNEEVLSAGLRSSDGRLLVSTRSHSELWVGAPEEKSSPTHARVPIFRGPRQWGTVEVRFEPLSRPGLAGLWYNPLVRLMLFLALSGFLAYLLYMRRTLRHLDPEAVIPPRVQDALDVLAEGVILLDDRDQIVLANRAFVEKMDRSISSFIGRRPSELPWKFQTADDEKDGLPWQRARRDGRPHTGTPLVCTLESGERRTFMVNSAPILDGAGKPQGVLATFDDVTQLEDQNARLEFLATRDPLTSCLNRRSFVERLETAFAAAVRDGKPLSCIMSDIDHFKRINDDHGHLVGDQVIQLVAQRLGDRLERAGWICRYGGEEFCVLLPGVDLEHAAALAEEMRRAIALDNPFRIPVTMSFGVSALGFGAKRATELVDEADRALYMSKNQGRDRVMRWE